jgi:uncharacterized protein
MSLKNIDTPCIGICSTIYGDAVCRGCKRSYQEVIDWNTYDDAQKQVIMQRLEQQIVVACQDKLIVTDAALLQQQLVKFNIRYRLESDPLCWAFYLLREGSHKIQDLSKYGIALTAQYQDLTLSMLYQQIDEIV